jgi:hypothetical protein
MGGVRMVADHRGWWIKAAANNDNDKDEGSEEGA